MMKFLFLVLLECIFLVVMFIIQWIYKDENHLYWCNDIEIIEQLHGEQRTQYVKESKNLIFQLLYALMLAIAIFFFFDINTPTLLCGMIIFISVTTFYITKTYHLQKNYKNLIKRNKKDDL